MCHWSLWEAQRLRRMKGIRGWVGRRQIRYNVFLWLLSPMDVVPVCNIAHCCWVSVVWGELFWTKNIQNMITRRFSHWATRWPFQPTNHKILRIKLHMGDMGQKSGVLGLDRPDIPCCRSYDIPCIPIVNPSWLVKPILGSPKSTSTAPRNPQPRRLVDLQSCPRLFGFRLLLLHPVLLQRHWICLKLLDPKNDDYDIYIYIYIYIERF